MMAIGKEALQVVARVDRKLHGFPWRLYKLLTSLQTGRRRIKSVAWPFKEQLKI